jgi:hypothetical protein
MGGAGRDENVLTVLRGKPEGKRPLRRPVSESEGMVKLDSRRIR